MKKVLAVLMMLTLALGVLPAGAAAYDDAGDPFTTDLIAGQNTDAGDVLVWNDLENLYVQFVPADGWCIAESHVAVGGTAEEIPQNKAENPTPGKFMNSRQYSPCEMAPDAYKIPLEWAAYDTAYIAAHAVVGKAVEGCTEEVWQIGDMEEYACADGTQLTNYADEFNWPEAGPCTAGLPLTEQEPEFTNPFIVGTTPTEEFPYNSNYNRRYATDFDVQWNGELNFGGDLIVSWSPGQSAAEKKVVSDGFDPATLTAEGTAVSGEGYFLDKYPLVEQSIDVPAVEAGTHTINFQHTQGDGTFWDWIRLEKPCEQWETAWGEGMSFDGANWAMYFTYQIQPVFVEQVKVPSNGDVVKSTNALGDGESYLFEASGRYKFANWEAYEAGIADAKCSKRYGSYIPAGYDYDNPDWVLGEHLNTPYGLQVQVDTQGTSDITSAGWYWEGEGCNEESNEYKVDYTGTGVQASFYIYDDNYGDNDGYITVDIYALP